MNGKKVKVVLLCMCGSENHPTYGKNGVLHLEWEKELGQQIDFVSFAGKYIPRWGDERTEFLNQCQTADVVILDAWNHPGEDSKEKLSCREAEKEMADLAKEILLRNPFVKLFAELMEGLYKVAVHDHAIPVLSFGDEIIGKTICDCAKVDHRPMVLVLDDSPIHSGAAKVSLTDDCQLLIVNEFEQAEKLINGGFAFDAVLLDLMLPAPERTMGPKGQKYVGQEMPIGNWLVILALKKGIKNIGLVTDTGHHDHPASACIDVFGRGVFTIGDSKVLCTNGHITSVDEETFEEVQFDFLNTEEGKTKYPQQPDYSRKGIIKAKAWRDVLVSLGVLKKEHKKSDVED